MIYIFLDFDGVLHGDRFDSIPFEHMTKFSQHILPYKDKAKIVISSSWRETHTFENLINFFPEELQPMIAGVTPILPDNMEEGAREKEIQAYCEANAIANNQWIAIDDMPNLFSQETQDQALIGGCNVLFTEKSTGLTDFDFIMLKNMIENRIENKTIIDF